MLTIDLKQEIVKATLVKTLLDKIPSYLYSRTILPTIQQVCGASKKYEVTACKLSFSAVIRLFPIINRFPLNFTKNSARRSYILALTDYLNTMVCSILNLIWFFFGKIQWEASAYEVSIPALLHGHFMEHYNRLNNECCEAISNRMQGVVRRNGLMAFRIIMVQTIVGHLADECYPDAGRTTSETRMY